MEIQIVQLGARMPMSTRRVVRFCGEPAQYKLPIGVVEGLADGAVVYRRFGRTATGVHDVHVELTPAQAQEIASAFSRAAVAVEQWQEKASGFNRIRVARAEDGAVTVTWRGRTRPMRESKLRGSRWRDGSIHFRRRCGACGDYPPVIWVAADVVREHGTRVAHAEVCPACVEKLSNIPEPVAVVVQIREPAG